MNTNTTLTSARNLLKRFEWRQNIIYIGFIAVFALFTITLGDSGFSSPNNLMNIFRQTATISIMAVAMTYVIAAAEKLGLTQAEMQKIIDDSDWARCD
jgi:ribose transport system permease protein